MRIKLLTISAVALAVVLGLGVQGAFATHLGVPHSPDGQTFNVDVDLCQDSNNGMTGGESTVTFPALAACGAEDLAAGSATALTTSITQPAGNRLGLPQAYADAAFGSTADAGIVDGTVVGNVKALTDIGCDGTADIFADGSNTPPVTFGPATGEPFAERTTAFGPATGIGGTSEQYLIDTLPPASGSTTNFPYYVRFRADIDTLFVSGGTVTLGLANPTALNVVVQTLPWGTGARLSSTLLGGNPSAPSTQVVLCLDSPQSSQAEYTTAAGFSNPAAPGLYARWTSLISAAGIVDDTKQTFVYTTSCKRIGGAVADADNDCLSDAADADDADADQDNDGLLDGIENSWGSSITSADTDSDGRTDTEEMLGPSTLLTNPTLADTDGDGKSDAGLNLDCGGDGVPDSGVTIESGPALSGRNRVKMEIVNCGGVGGLGGSPVGNAGAAASTWDNCPNQPNASQLNTASADYPNDKIVGTYDTTQVDGRYFGDDCVGDSDNDGINDVIENTGYNYDAAASGDSKCNTTGAGVAIPTGATGDGSNSEGTVLDTAHDPDMDNDGTIDGVECQLNPNGSNPNDVTSKNLVPLSAADATQFFRAKGLVLGPSNVDADFDQDSALGAAQLGGASDYNTDADGNCNTSGVDGQGQPKCVTMPDGAQDKVGDGLTTRGDVGKGGVGAAGNPDMDRDACADIVEVIDVNGDRVANSSDKLQLDRAVAAKFAWLSPAVFTALEQSIFDANGDGSANSTDQLAYARALAGKFGPFNTNCTAGNIGNAGAN